MLLSLAIFYNFYRSAASLWCCPFRQFLKKTDNFRLKTRSILVLTNISQTIIIQYSSTISN